MDGIQVEEGKRLLAESGLNVKSADTLGDGAAKIVAMVNGPGVESGCG